MATTEQNKSLTRTRKSGAEWQALMHQYEQSNLTRKQFCAQQSLALSTFDYWRHKLRENHSGREDEIFVALSDEPRSVLPDKKSWDVELQLGPEVFLRLRHPC